MVNHDFKVGLSGAAAHIESHHRHAIEASDSFELAAVCDSNLPKLNQIYNGSLAEARFTKYEEMLAVADIDTVVIMTPHHLHVPMAREALAVGKHVISEKPLAISAQSAQELHDFAMDKAGILVVAYHARLGPEMKAFKELQASGEIGKVKHFSYQCSGCCPDRPWFFKSEFGGGPLRDMGTNALSAILPAIANSEAEIADLPFEIRSSVLKRKSDSVVDTDVEDKAIVSVSVGDAFGSIVTDWQVRGQYVAQTEFIDDQNQIILVDHAASTVTIGSRLVYPEGVIPIDHGGYADSSRYTKGVYPDAARRIREQDSNVRDAILIASIIDEARSHAGIATEQSPLIA